MSLLASPCVKWCGGGWLFFVAENAVMSENRGAVIDVLGSEKTYRGVYGLLSSGSLLSIAYGLWRHGPGPRLSAAPVGVAPRLLGLAFQTAGLVGAANLAPALANPLSPGFMGCPLDLERKKADAAAKDSGDAVGLKRVTRHPTFWTMGFLGLGVAAQTPFAGTAVAALGFPLVAAVGGAHMDSRHRRGMGGSLTPEREAATSGIPFLALLEGRQSWAALGEELKPVNSGLGVLASAGLAAFYML
mmetsp:Transcript_15975/g.47658  ORF Transcript_15975/g.47658 Transcript_15975/m.47658 type:complete len:245 (-) Transcript_15975:35-769(-)